MSSSMNPVGWFEIPVKSISRAKAFYEHVFGFQLSIHEMGPVKMAMFPMIEKGMGATGSLCEGPGYTPSHGGCMVYFSVPSIEKALEKIAAKSGKPLMPKTSIGEWGFIANFEDCEGNRVALHAMN